jgi:glycosyltransferase 2 family protein
LSLSRLLRLTVAIGLTAYIVWKANPRAVVEATHGADPIWILYAVLLVLVDRALNAWRWIELLAALSPGSRPPFSTVLRIFFVSTFVGSFLPSVGGDVYRAYSLSRYDVRLSESAASVLMDRVLGVLSMVLLSAAALATAPQIPRDSWTRISLAAAGAGCAIAGVVVFSSRAADAIRHAASRLPSPRVHRIASTLTDAVRRYASHHGELVRVLAASVMVQALRVVQAFCLGRAIGIDVPVGMYFVFIPIAVLMMQIPITVSGLGVAQGAFVWLFGQPGVPAAQATALSLLFIALGFLGNLPGALLYAMGERPKS